MSMPYLEIMTNIVAIVVGVCRYGWVLDPEQAGILPNRRVSSQET